MLNNPLLHPLSEPTGGTFFGTFVTGAIGLAFLLGVLFFLGNLVVGALAWINSGDQKQNLETARTKITSAMIGLVTLFSTYAIIGFIGYFFCVNLTVLNFANLVVGTGTGLAKSCPGMPGVGGGGNGGGNNGGNGNGGVTGTGVAACGCANGGCAQAGDIALGNQTGGTTCNVCTSNGWSTNVCTTTITTNCVPAGRTCSGNSPITCYSTCR